MLPSAYEDGVGQLAAGALHHGRVVILHEDGGGQKGQQDSWQQEDSNSLALEVVCSPSQTSKDNESFKILCCYKTFSPFLLDCYWECQLVSN